MTATPSCAAPPRTDRRRPHPPRRSSRRRHRRDGQGRVGSAGFLEYFAPVPDRLLFQLQARPMKSIERCVARSLSPVTRAQGAGRRGEIRHARDAPRIAGTRDDNHLVGREDGQPRGDRCMGSPASSGRSRSPKARGGEYVAAFARQNAFGEQLRRCRSQIDVTPARFLSRMRFQAAHGTGERIGVEDFERGGGGAPAAIDMRTPSVSEARRRRSCSGPLVVGQRHRHDLGDMQRLSFRAVFDLAAAGKSVGNDERKHDLRRAPLAAAPVRPSCARPRPSRPGNRKRRHAAAARIDRSTLRSGTSARQASTAPIAPKLFW